MPANRPKSNARNSAKDRVGLAYWMKEVLNRCENVAADFDSDSVHDLRTALRRCRSMADGLMVFDSDPEWKRMKKAGKLLFRSLGDLRDVQVMGQWVKQFSPNDDLAGKILSDYVADQEQSYKTNAAIALHDFDRKLWSSWAEELPARAGRIPPASPMFAHLALEKWNDARTRHRHAMRNRSSAAYHQLRIGLKRFRYIVENFLPALDAQWGKDLKQLQDALGEVHDFDVLWDTALKIDAFPDAQTRVRWHDRLNTERMRRIALYREKALGPNSLWRQWRAGLPPPDELRGIALQRMQTWAASLDPDHLHARHVSRLALELYDGLSRGGIIASSSEPRQLLELAALLHDVGRSGSARGHHKLSAKMIRKITPPLGWSAEELRFASLIARYHRGALPRESHKRFRSLSKSQKKRLLLLGGILRLACACDRQRDGQIRHLWVDSDDTLLKIRAQGLSQLTPVARHLASARYLLEVACQRPVFVLPAQAEAQLAATKAALGAA